MKRFILLLILTLFLTFTLIGNCAWLSGWDYRIELAIGDYAGDIGASVTWFPVTVFLTSTQGEEVFVELTTDAEYKKIQFTQSDGTSLLYGHKKLFDASEELGIFTVSATGWTIDSNTSVFLYYDKDHADNDTYIGATNTAACEAVYNAEYKAVYTMADGADTSHIYDATSNNNDGTKKGANEPIEATGKVGQGQDFDGTDDYISVADSNSLDITTAITFECLVNFDAVNVWQEILTKRIWDTEVAYAFRMANDGKLTFYYDTGTTIHIWRETNAGSLATTDYYLAFIFVPGVTPTMEIRVNGASPIAGSWIIGDGTDDMPSNAIPVILGGFYDDSSYNGGKSKGVFDEHRLSNSQRSAAWIKGTYNSLWDSLLTYGSEETEEVEVNALFFGNNF